MEIFMEYYHGSPILTPVLHPRKAKGHTDFQNLEAVFVTDNYNLACYYAVSKSLEGRTWFAVQPNGIHVLGDHKLETGYVYILEPNPKSVIKGDETSADQYAITVPAYPVHIDVIKPSKFKGVTYRYHSKDEFKEALDFT
jgi:hypothetical protein